MRQDAVERPRDVLEVELEDELTRAVGPDGMERVLAEQGELPAFRTYQKQPAHRARSLEEQLHGFMWNRKQKYGTPQPGAAQSYRR